MTAWSSGSILITLCTRSAIFLVRFISIMDAVGIRSSGTSSVGEPAGWRARLRQTRGVGNVDDISAGACACGRNTRVGRRGVFFNRGKTFHLGKTRSSKIGQHLRLPTEEYASKQFASLRLSFLGLIRPHVCRVEMPLQPISALRRTHEADVRKFVSNKDI